MHIDRYDGDRILLLPLFLLADDSLIQTASYISRDEVLLAWDGDQAIGYLQILETEDSEVLELRAWR